MAVMARPSQKQDQEWPIPRLWTIEEFEEAGDLGLFDPEERLELLYGEVYKKLSPQRSPHATAVDVAADAVRESFGKGVRVRVQTPFNIGQISQPEPDICVVKGAARDFAKSHPRTAELIIEVSDATLKADLGKKAALFAAAGVPDYWVIDLKNRALIVHREPGDDPDSPSGFIYQSIVTYGPTDSVRPLRADSDVKVADLLP